MQKSMMLARHTHRQTQLFKREWVDLAKDNGEGVKETDWWQSPSAMLSKRGRSHVGR